MMLYVTPAAPCGPSRAAPSAQQHPSTAPRLCAVQFPQLRYYPRSIHLGFFGSSPFIIRRVAPKKWFIGESRKCILDVILLYWSAPGNRKTESGASPAAGWFARPGAVSGPRTGPRGGGSGGTGSRCACGLCKPIFVFSIFRGHAHAPRGAVDAGDPPIRAGPPGKTAGRSRTPRAGILREPPTEAQAPRPTTNQRTHAGS